MVLHQTVKILIKNPLDRGVFFNGMASYLYFYQMLEAFWARGLQAVGLSAVTAAQRRFSDAAAHVSAGLKAHLESFMGRRSVDGVLPTDDRGYRGGAELQQEKQGQTRGHKPALFVWEVMLASANPRGC